MTKPFRRLMIILSAFILLTDPVWASLHQPRTVLLVYDSQDGEWAESIRNRMEKAVPFILNYLGLKVRFHDIQGGNLPADESLTDVRAVVTWFLNEEMDRPEEFLAWAGEQIRAGRRYVILCNMGAFIDRRTKQKVPLDKVNELFHLLDLEYRGNWTDDPWVIREVKKDPEKTEFERTLEGELDYYEQILSLKETNDVALSLERTDLENSASAMVVVTARGGYVQQSYLFYTDPVSNQLRWRIDPFWFFEASLGLKGIPRYDTTTLEGKRIFYSHVDGDGFRNRSLIQSDLFSSEVLLNEIVRRYPVPIAVSFISADVLPEYLGNERLKKIAETIARESRVEIGVHGFSHPLDWDLQITSYVIPGYSTALENIKDDLVSESVYTQGAKVERSRSEFFRREISGAADEINRLLPPGKKAMIYQWTGNCRPPGEAVRIAYEKGLKNINGGDSRFDALLPTYTEMAPLDRVTSGGVQVMTSNSNENIYTNLWTGPFDGFKHVVETFQQTEAPTLIKTLPRRVSPINVYFHFYSAERQASLDAVKEVLDYALRQEVIPLFASEYSGIVQDFEKGRIEKTSDGGWRFSEYGANRTVRMDGFEQFPDIEKSTGIMGFTEFQGSLYLHLKEGHEALVYWTGTRPQGFYLSSASAPLSGWQVEKGTLQWKTRVIGKAEFKIHVPDRNLFYRVQYREIHSGRMTPEESLKPDADGFLSLTLFEDGNWTVMLREVR